MRQDSAVAAVSFYLSLKYTLHWPQWSVQEERSEEKRDKHLVGNQQPSSEQGRQVPLQWSFWNSEEKMLLQGSTARLKAAVLLFHFALTRRLQTTVNLSVFVLFSSQGLWSAGWGAEGGGIVSHQSIGCLYGTGEDGSHCTAPFIKKKKKWKIVLAWKSLSKALFPKTSALQAQQVQISHMQKHSTHFKALCGI